MNTEIELKNHIDFEFHPFKPLYESRGVVDNIDEIVNAFVNMVEDQIIELYVSDKPYIKKSYNNFNQTYIKSGVKPFFNSFKLDLVFCKREKSGYKGGVNCDSVIKNERGEYISYPKIFFQISANSILESIRVFKFCLGHELTHAYGALMYAIKNGKDQFDSVFNKNKYGKIVSERSSAIQNVAATADMLYNLSKIERNAYIAQLRQELLDKKDYIVNSKSAFEAIKSTESYRRLIKMEENIDIINSDKLSDNTKKELRLSLNSIMDKNFTNFEQVKSYYNKRWEKWKKVYLTKASKIAYDIYSETHLMYDGFDMSEPIKIKH